VSAKLVSQIDGQYSMRVNEKFVLDRYLYLRQRKSEEFRESYIRIRFLTTPPKQMLES